MSKTKELKDVQGLEHPTQDNTSNTKNNLILNKDDGCKIVKEKETLPIFMKTKNKMDHQYVYIAFLKYLEDNNSRLYTMSDTKEMYIYKNGIYRKGGEDDIIIFIKRLCGNESSINRQKEVIDNVIYSTLINRKEFNKNNCELNLLNGIYNYETKTFEKHTRNKLFTHQFNVKYNPDVKCPVINAFFNDILKEKDKLLVLESFAYCFVPNYRIQNYFLFYGNGNQGKGVAFSLLENLLGRENYTSVSIQDLCNNHNYTQAYLYGKKANICGDMPKTTLRNTDFIKKATGGDYITVRNIMQGPFDLINTAKFFFAANEIPNIVDDSDGFYRRIIPITFENTISKEKLDINIIDKITTDNEKSGLFNLLMQVLPNLLERGKFSFDGNLNDIREMFNEHSDHIAAFMSQCTIFDNNSFVMKDDFYLKYKEWCISKNITFLSKNILGKRLKNKSLKYNLNDGKRIDKTDHKQKTSWVGIDLI